MNARIWGSRTVGLVGLLRGCLPEKKWMNSNRPGTKRNFHLNQLNQPLIFRGELLVLGRVYTLGNLGINIFGDDIWMIGIITPWKKNMDFFEHDGVDSMSFLLKSAWFSSSMEGVNISNTPPGASTLIQLSIKKTTLSGRTSCCYGCKEMAPPSGDQIMGRGLDTEKA